MDNLNLRISFIQGIQTYHRTGKEGKIRENGADFEYQSLSSTTDYRTDSGTETLIEKGKRSHAELTK